MNPNAAPQIPTNNPLKFTRISNQLELDILELNNDTFEGIIEFDSELNIRKCDSFSASFFQLNLHPKNGDGCTDLKKSPQFDELRKYISSLGKQNNEYGNRATITRKDSSYDLLLSKLTEDHFTCRIRKHIDPARSLHESPLVAAGILLWSMDERTQTTKFHSPPLLSIQSINNSNSNNIFDWINQIHPEDQNGFQSKFETFLNGFYGSFHHRYRIETDSGNYEHITTIARRARPTINTTVVEISGMHINDAVIEKPKDELRILSYLAKKARIPISITDAEGRSIWINTSFYNNFGYKNHELKKKPLFDSLSGPLTNPNSLNQYADCLKQNKTFSIEIISHLSDGEPIWCKSISKPMLDADGNAKRYITFLSDITEYKKANNAFLQNEEKFRYLFKNAVDSLLVVSLDDGRIKESNAAAKTLFSCSNLLGTFIEDLTIEKGFFAIDEFRKKLEGKPFYSERIKLHVTKQAPYTVDLLVNKLDIGPDNTALVTIRNVTNELFLEEQLLHSQKMQAVGKLAGGVAHDFNNLLSGIRGFSELIANSNELSETNRIYLNELLKTSDRASKLASRLLSFSRQRSDTPKVCDLNEIVNNISPMLSRIIQQDIHFKITIGAKKCYSLLDASQIEQAIMNLVVNAQEATSGSNRFVELRTYSKTLNEETRYSTGIARAGNYHILEVIDNGHGMSPEVIERIFEPFFTTKEGAGTGLGLAIAYSIVNKSGGYANIDSAPGEGTRFSLIFPETKELCEAEAAPETVENVPFAQSENAQTILIAEDQESLREILQISLEKIGHNLIIAKDGKEALDLYKTHQAEIDLVLTDSIMPQMVGSELALNIRKINKDERIVIMSGLPEEELFKDTEAVEIDAFVSKPFSIKDVLTLVENLLVKQSV